MATGYTAEIEKGITFEKFVMQCARAFGACVMMRDDPMDAEIPEVFESSKFHIEHIEEVQETIKDLESMYLSVANDKAVEEYRQEVIRHQERISEKNALREKYNAMLSKVKAWQPPTPDHQGLKDFMIQQIESSIDFDCDTEWYIKNYSPVLLTGEQWLTDKIAKALKDLDYHTKENQKEIERAEGRTAWIKALRDSLSK